MKLGFLIGALAILFAVTLAPANAATIEDTYWGGGMYNASPTDYGDVIQPAGSHNYEVDRANITYSGSTVTITLTGGYFAPNNPDRSVWVPGDLYIASQGWKVTDASDPVHFSTNTFDSSQGWNYVVSLADGKVYQLDYSTITMTSAPTDDYVIRMNQALTGGYGTLVTQGTVVKGWENGESYLSFTFDTSALGLQNNFGLHWTMQCGNDVLNGPVSVPEPSTLFLLGIGLVGLAAGKKSAIMSGINRTV